MDHLERVKQEFTRQAEAFSASAAITDSALTARFVEAMGGAARGRILDVACGPGIIAAALAAEAREVIAFDLTPEMLRKAEQRCAKTGRKNVMFKEGNATELPFANSAFDGVATRLSMHHFQDPRRVLDEVFRVLRPGGTFVLADVVSSETKEDADLQNAIEMLRDPSHTRMLSQSELLSMVKDTSLIVARQATWDKPREFEEWMGIINDATRVAPLRTVVHALADAGRTAGMGLSLVDGRITFFHRWSLMVARKPG